MPYVGVGPEQDSKRPLLASSMLKVYAITAFSILLMHAIAGLGKHHSLHPAPHPKLETVSGTMNFTYRVGPGFRSNERLTMDVRGSLIVKRIRNVIGYIRGKDEPDRYVMLGNHYDAKSHLSKDPRSGTAILAEVARAMMQTINGTGWRPGSEEGDSAETLANKTV